VFWVDYYPHRDNNGWSSSSEVATLQLELKKYLDHHKDDYTDWRAADVVCYKGWMWSLHEVTKKRGNTLVPIFIRYAVPLSLFQLLLIGARYKPVRIQDIRSQDFIWPRGGCRDPVLGIPWSPVHEASHIPSSP
jgi:hypothetical protein